LQQAGRELLLAQASDWPFIVSTGTSPGYARNRLKSHLSRFHRLHQQIAAEAIDVEWLASIESLDPVFPDLRSDYWR
jgi:1,4-alpha-glucan branching enzyme